MTIKYEIFRNKITRYKNLFGPPYLKVELLSDISIQISRPVEKSVKIFLKVLVHKSKILMTTKKILLTKYQVVVLEVVVLVVITVTMVTKTIRRLQEGLEEF